jgi:hypothetical protein
MASQDREDPVQELISQYLPTATLSEARNLVHRFQEGEAFRLYVVRRIWLVIPAGLVMLLVSLACAAATVLFLAGGGSWFALPAFLLAPFILIGSLFVQLYVFFSWLESRALAQAFRRRTRPVQGALAKWLAKKTGADMGAFPPVPWILAAVVLFAPLAMLMVVAVKVALLLIPLALLTPILYALFDR